MGEQPSFTQPPTHPHNTPSTLALKLSCTNTLVIIQSVIQSSLAIPLLLPLTFSPSVCAWLV